MGYYHDEVTTRQSVAMVTDDPEHKKKLKSDLAGAFAEDGGVLAGLPADASEEEIDERLRAAGLSEADAKMMMKANKGKGLSPEARALSTTRGVDKVNGREIDMVQYEGT